MDALKFLQERDRMCKAHYNAEKGQCRTDCPAYNIQCLWLEDIGEDAKELVAKVDEWSAAHPRKTRQSVFLEQYPETNISEHGVLLVCPCPISASHRNAHGGCAIIGRRCDDCRKEYWLQEVE